MKTLQECKDEVAKKYGRKSFYTLMCIIQEPSKQIEAIDEAAELYAQQFKDELEQGAEYVVRLSDSIGKLCDEIKTLKEEKAKLIEALSEIRHAMYARDDDDAILHNIGNILTANGLPWEEDD